MELSELLQIKKTRTTPYPPPLDGLMERFNRTLESVLCKYVSENQQDWETCLAFIMFAYQSCGHESIKYCPYFMMFRRDVRLAIDSMFGEPQVGKKQ